MIFRVMKRRYFWLALPFLLVFIFGSSLCKVLLYNFFVHMIFYSFLPVFCLFVTFRRTFFEEPGWWEVDGTITGVYMVGWVTKVWFSTVRLKFSLFTCPVPFFGPLTIPRRTLITFSLAPFPTFPCFTIFFTVPFYRWTNNDFFQLAFWFRWLPHFFVLS